MTAYDRFGAGSPESIACADDAFAITPSDSAELTYVIRQIYVGGGGNVKVVTAGGSTVTHVGVLAGTYLSGLRIRKVLSTGTTATNMVAYV